MPFHDASHLCFRWSLNLDCELSPAPYIICLGKDLRRICTRRSSVKLEPDNAGIFSVEIILSDVIETIIINIVTRVVCIWFSLASDPFDDKRNEVFLWGAVFPYQLNVRHSQNKVHAA
jgi:hypothetical protein